MNNIAGTDKCIGILGGTFNPVHKGHIMMALAAIKAHPEIRKLLFMPNNRPYYKDNSDISADTDRINMLMIAIRLLSRGYVSDMEIKRGGVTYTIDTIRQIRSKYPGLIIYLIIGADSLMQLDTWKEYKEIIKECVLIVINRDNYTIEELDYKIKSFNCDSNIEILNTEKMEASSTSIREAIRAGNTCEAQLDDMVYDYIVSHKLYQ